MPQISSDHRVTLPVETLATAGLRSGDKVTVEADGPGNVVVRRKPARPDSALGVIDGLYKPGYLHRLRSEEHA